MTDPEHTLARILELTRAEAAHIEAADADALTPLLRERGALLAALPASLPERCRPLAEAFELQRAANQAAAERVAASLRQQLDAMTATRTVVTAYSPNVGRRETRHVAVDRAG